jgi:hypothetical protein
MKRMLIVLVLACAATSLPRAAETLPPNPAAIAEVKAGKRPMAEAAWWGFDPRDATAALQAAIDSGARKVILKAMPSPWVVGPINLAGDQELVLEKGAVLQARRGAFMEIRERLLSATNKKNVAITGPGATIRMWRADYDKPPYAHSEWRHAIGLYSCANVRITGVTIAESGGDGIYLGVAKGGGTNRNVEIRDVICDRNYRQGISVISADGLLIENTVLRATSGTAPMAGIDFEPNLPTEMLANCVMRNCLAENNAGCGYTMYLKQLGEHSAPISLRFENCRSVGNSYGFHFASGDKDLRSCVPGSVKAVGCIFEGNKKAGIAIADKPAAICPMEFMNCRVVADEAREDPMASPIQLAGGANNDQKIGGVTFINCTVADSRERLPLAYQDLAGGVKLAGVTGTLAVERAGSRTIYPLNPQLLEKWFPIQAFKDFPEFRPEGLHWEPVARAAQPARNWSCTARLREHSGYLIWAGAGEEVVFTLKLRRVGKASTLKMPVSVVSPAGESQKLAEATGEGDKQYHFTAASTGGYRILCDPGRNTVQMAASSHPVCLYTAGKRIHLLGAAGDLYFAVPAGLREFALRLGSGGDGELVKAAIYDASGAKVAEQDDILSHQFVCNRPRGAGTEVWRVRLERPTHGAIEDYYLNLQGVAPLLATSPHALLKPVP